MSAADAKEVEKFLNFLKAGDIEGAVGQMAEDVVLVESGSIPHSGTYRGHAGVYELIGKIGELFGGFEINDITVHDAGEFVVGRMVGTFISKSGDKKVEMPAAEHYWLRDGKVYHADVYYKDPNLLDELA